MVGETMNMAQGLETKNQTSVNGTKMEDVRQRLQVCISFFILWKTVEK